MKRTIRRTLPAPRAILGFRQDGRPIYPILGASEDDSSNDDGGADGDDGAAVDDGSGDDGKPDPAAAQKKVNRDLERKLNEARREIDQLKATGKPAGQGDDGEPDVEKLVETRVKEQLTEAQKRADARVLRSEIKAAAAGKLADPADALAFLDLSSFEVDADGSVDEQEIAEAIDDLLTRKPHLAAQGGRSKGSADGGPRNEDTGAQTVEDWMKTFGGR
jgi:hypothetical protein